MASQPANTAIAVFRRVRGIREPVRHDSVKNITHKLRRLILMPPHEEIRTQVVARDTNTTDFSAYMGEATSQANRGHPVVIGVRAVRDFSAMQQITGVDFPVEIGHDMFVQEAPERAGQDLHQDARNTV